MKGTRKAELGRVLCFLLLEGKTTVLSAKEKHWKYHLVFKNWYAFFYSKNIQLFLIKFGNKWTSPSGKTCIITKIKGFDKMLGQLPIQPRASGDNSMNEKVWECKESLLILCNNKTSLQQTKVGVKVKIFIKLYSQLKKVQIFCLLHCCYPILCWHNMFFCIWFLVISLPYGPETCNDILFLQRAGHASWWMRYPMVREMHHLLQLSKVTAYGQLAGRTLQEKV